MATEYNDLPEEEQLYVDHHLRAILDLMDLPLGFIDGLIDALDNAAHLANGGA